LDPPARRLRGGIGARREGPHRRGRSVALPRRVERRRRPHARGRRVADPPARVDHRGRLRGPRRAPRAAPRPRRDRHRRARPR
jgi:hypothetical protein